MVDELLERFVVGIERLATASERQVEILTQNYCTPEGKAPEKKANKKAEKTAEPAADKPATGETAPEQPATEQAADEAITKDKCNEILKKVATAKGVPFAKEFLAKHLNGATGLGDMDPAQYPVVYKACQEVLDAAN